MRLDVLVLGAMAVAAVSVWSLVFLLRGGGLTAHRRAALLFTAAVAQPLVVTGFSTQTASTVGVETVVTPTGALLGQALTAATLALSLTLILFPGHKVGRGGGRLILFGAWVMAAALWVASLLSPQPGSAQYQIVFALALTALVLGVRDHETLLAWGRYFTRLVVGASLAMAVLVPERAFIAASDLGVYDRTLFGLPRLSGVTPHPNALAGIAVLGLLLEAGHTHGWRLTRAIWFVATAGCVLLAQSNTGYIAAAVGLFMLLAARRPAARLLAYGTGIVVLVVYMFAPGALVPAQLEESGYVTSVSGRAAIWDYALAEWQNHPWTGYGPSMFSPDYLATHFPSTLQQATNGHNQVVQTLADSGLFGLAGLVLLAIGLLTCAWRSRRLDAGMSLALVWMLAAFSLTETPLRPVGLTFVPALVVLGVAAIGSRQASADSTNGADRTDRGQTRERVPQGAGAPGD